MNLNKTLAVKLGVDPKQVEILMKAFSDVLSDSIDKGAGVAIPSFGTFRPVKHEEQIITEPNGIRMMYPPSIEVEFAPAVSLRNKISESHE